MPVYNFSTLTTEMPFFQVPLLHVHMYTVVRARPPLQPEEYGIKLEVVLKWKDIYIENIRMLSLIDGFKNEGIVKWRSLKSQGPL